MAWKNLEKYQYSEALLLEVGRPYRLVTALGYVPPDWSYETYCHKGQIETLVAIEKHDLTGEVFVKLWGVEQLVSPEYLQNPLSDNETSINPNLLFRSKIHDKPRRKL